MSSPVLDPVRSVVSRSSEGTRAVADSTFPRRLVKLGVMLRWAMFDGRFEPEDEQRIPLRRALSFAWADANVLGDLGITKSACGCKSRFGRPLVLCGRHAFGDDWGSGFFGPTG